MKEFDLLCTTLGKGQEEAVKGGVEGPSVWVVIKGGVEMSVDGQAQKERLEEGHVVFVKPGTKWKMRSEGGAELWAAFVE